MSIKIIVFRRGVSVIIFLFLYYYDIGFLILSLSTRKKIMLNENKLYGLSGLPTAELIPENRDFQRFLGFLGIRIFFFF